MGLWSRARELAERTPPDRNRYVDFLRAVSILFVVTGHWLIATATYEGGRLIPGDILEIQPATQWLTWIFQVMPVFFFVGGYANAVSLEGAARRGTGYAEWLAARLGRLATPVIVLLVVWAGIAGILRLFDVSRGVVRFASQAGLVPTWFLAIYIVIALLAPAMYRAWKRWGFASIAALLALAIVSDASLFLADLPGPGWTNYLTVWLAVHQLGYAWRDGRTGSPGRSLAIAGLAAGALVALVLAGPYPVAMAGSPDEELSNSLPPKIVLALLGFVQFGVLLAIERPMRRLLARPAPWTATILINGMIMTVYLWHVTVLIVLVSLAFLAGGVGLTVDPGSGAWWLSRLPWLAVLYAVLLVVALVMAPLERPAPRDGRRPRSAASLVGGALAVCTGIALLAMNGFGGGGFRGFGVLAFALVLGGAGVAGVLPTRRRGGG